MPEGRALDRRRFPPAAGRGALAAVLTLLAAALASSAAANPIQAENRRPGDSGWQLPVDAGQLISGYAAETSVTPGQSFHLHVSAPAGSGYQVRLYRLGWYGGEGGRLVLCVPACRGSRPAVSQPAPSAPRSSTGWFHAGWKLTDTIRIPTDAVSGYYEAKLQVTSGTATGAVGAIPLIVREPVPRARVLIEVPVNTWQAYNPWGGKSLYGVVGTTHALEVSFDRPYDAAEWHAMALDLELPWVRFLEREGVDLAYQTDADTDRDPASLVEHRLVFAIGHDEYWTQRMRDAFDRARAAGTNLMFGSNSGMWRIRYADHRRTIVEWRNPYVDPIHDRRRDTGEFRLFGEPECQLMGVQYLYYAHRPLAAPPTAYTVVGAAGDPWLSAAALRPGDVVPGVVGYEWDSLVPGCFRGRVTSLMHASYPGADGIPRSADMVRAVARSGARVFAMGTMELGWALDDFTGETPDPRIVALVRTALDDLGRPAPPARLVIRRAKAGVLVTARLLADDPRVERVSVRRLGSRVGCRDALRRRCVLPGAGGPARYRAVAVDRWASSQPLLTAAVSGAPR